MLNYIEIIIHVVGLYDLYLSSFIYTYLFHILVYIKNPVNTLFSIIV